MMNSVDRAIFRKFQVYRDDNLPHTGRTATREALAELFAELGYKKGAEIGVRYGHYSQLLCAKNPDLELFCIDPWSPYRKHSAESMEGIYQVAKAKLAQYKTTIIRKTSMEAVKEIPDNSLDFVYIDAMHEFDPVMMDILHWVPKVRRGGIVAGHDYCWYYQGGVTLAVDTYTRAHNINTWYITQLDREPSWLWVQL